MLLMYGEVLEMVKNIDHRVAMFSGIFSFTVLGLGALSVVLSQDNVTGQLML